MHYDRNALRLNVGFIVGQSIGYLREIPIEFAELHLPPDLDLKELSGGVFITRTPQGLLVQVQLYATTPAECGRCLMVFEQPLQVDFTDLYAFTKKSVSESGLILPESGVIDLAPLVREYMLLDIPINPLCSPDCKGLCPVCGEQLDEQEHIHEDEPIDPRFDQLKELLK
jgi:uncharacterized protein